MSIPHPGDYVRVHAPTSIRDSGLFKVISVKDGEASLAKATVWEDSKVVAKRPQADLIKAEPADDDLLGYFYFPYLKIVTDRVRSGETFDQAVKRLPNVKGAPVEVRDLLRDLVSKERGIKVAASRVVAAHEQQVVVAGVNEAGRFTTGQIDLEYRRRWGREATRSEVRRVALALDIDPEEYDESENDWVSAASEAFNLSGDDILSLEEDEADMAGVLWKDYADSVHREAGDDSALDRFLTHVGSALWPEARTAASKTTGDGTSVGFFIPVPEELAEQFPSLGKEDTSPPHVTLLYVGAVPKAREAEFITVSTRALLKQPGPIIATIGDPDFFVHPDKNRRVWYSAVTFSKDVAELRDRLWLALEEAGFKVEHSYPLAMFPHITLAYADGEAHEHSPWKGGMPGGAWSFDSLAVWGLSKKVEVSLGDFGGEDFAEVARATVASRVASTPVPPTGGECKVLDQTVDRVYWQAKSGSRTYWLITNYAGVIDQDAPLSGHQQGNYFKKRDGDAAWAQVKSAQRVASRWAADQIPGGIGDKKKPADFDKAQVEKGEKVEMEHTDDRAVAREIAVDHLTEDPDYYDKLEKIEKHGAKLGSDRASHARR